MPEDGTYVKKGKTQFNNVLTIRAASTAVQVPARNNK
jgi:hypothetical protein